MQARAVNTSPFQDFAFPWSMDEMEARPQEGADRTEPVRALPEAANVRESLPVVFRAWQLEHYDEFFPH